jgi:hypothetical protein
VRRPTSTTRNRGSGTGETLLVSGLIALLVVVLIALLYLVFTS